MNQGRAPKQGKKRNDVEEQTKCVDWFAWALQFALGLVVGCGVGFKIAQLFVRSHFADFDQMPIIIVAVGLCCGAFTSFLGNRAWLAPSIFMKAESPPPQIARKYSVLLGCVGAVVLMLILIQNGANTTLRTQMSSSMEVFLLLIATVPAFMLIQAMRKGTGFWLFGNLDREETPLLFWVYVSLNVVVLFCMLWPLFL
jgi:protein-S-isoprenylcysteine O-methyltransferase Ste14